MLELTSVIQLETELTLQNESFKFNKPVLTLR